MIPSTFGGNITKNGDFWQFIKIIDNRCNLFFIISSYHLNHLLMMSRKFFKPAIIAVALLATFFLSSYLKKTSIPAILEQCTCKGETKSSEEGPVKGDLFFWESITRNFTSIR